MSTNERVFNKNVSVNGQTALAVGDDIDLRIFLRDWKYGFYVEENENSSFQFFSKSGDAIHKIYKTNSSNEEGWKKIKSEFITEETQIETPQIKENPIRTNESHDETQIQSFLSDWSQLKDTHDFFSLLKRYNISREFAVATAENKFSFPISSRNSDSNFKGSRFERRRDYDLCRKPWYDPNPYRQGQKYPNHGTMVQYFRSRVQSAPENGFNP